MRQENALLNLIFNIILPVTVLEQLSKRIPENGPLIALIVAILIPIGYGFYDYMQRKQHNLISGLGVVNVALTGGFALSQLDGMWFAIKEAAFPLFIGIAVVISNFKGKPFIKSLFWNPNVIHTDLIESRVAELGKTPELSKLFRDTTQMLSLSFFLSAALNFFLAANIFVKIDTSLAQSERETILNQQIAEMTWKGYFVIALPMMILMIFTLWYLFNKLKKISELSLEEILRSDKAPSSTHPHN